jgi:guanine deaminase
MPPRTEHDCAYRGGVLRFLADPFDGNAPGSYEYFADGLLHVVGGHVAAVGPAEQLLRDLPQGIPVREHGGRLLIPGFIDTHIHYPQTDVIAAGGRELLDWLRDYTFPVEARFGEPAKAAEVAEFFLDELARNGTTTAVVFCTVHPQSVDAFFAAAAARRLRMIAGKVMMDRNAPAQLCDTAASSETQSRALLEAWHGRERLSYAITPRFAATSSDAQLAAAGRLAAEFPDVFIHSHLAENAAEIEWVRRLFPGRSSYLDVYDHFGLLRERAVYAHCIHLDGPQRQRFAASGACAAFCPSSNLYLGSGLFDIAAADAASMRFAIATDVGGGSSFSMLRTLADAHKVAQLRGQPLSPIRAFYLGTLGAARGLGLQDRIGSLAVGAEADFVILDDAATPLLARRSLQSTTLTERLRVLMTLGDDRAIAATFSLGRPQYLATALTRSHAAT